MIMLSYENNLSIQISDNLFNADALNKTKTSPC